MDTYKVKWTQLQSEIFRLLCIKAGEELNQRTMAKMLNVTATTIANALPSLEKEGLISREQYKKMNLNIIKLKRTQKAMQLKRVENLKMIYETGLAEFLIHHHPGTAIVLFGSYSRGDDITASDIDIAVIGMKEIDLDPAPYEKKLERTISMHYLVSLKEVSTEFRENLCNGIVLHGGIEL